MKKFVIALCVFALCCTLCVSAFAAPKQGGVTVGENHINVTVIEDFTGTSSSDNFANGSAGDEYWKYEFNGKTMAITLTGKDGVNCLYHMAAGEGPALAADADTKAAWANAKYVGYQIKNGSGQEVVLATESTVVNTDGSLNEWGALFQHHNTEDEIAQWPIVLIAADGTRSNGTEKTAGNGRGTGVAIPAGFTGWVFFPTARMNGLGEGCYFKNTCFYMDYDTENTPFTFLVNRVALADTMELAQGAGDLDGFESTDTADFSVIAYAVAAITGCGALVVAKKRG